MKDLKYWIWISRIKGINCIKKQRLLEQFKEPKNVWKLTREELLKIKGITEKNVEEILKKEYRYGLDKIENEMKEQNIELITYKDKCYPKKLKKIYDIPICLYVKGNKKILDDFSLAIIGCRENTEYGKKMAEAIGTSLGKLNITTVSGLAKGIDSISQRATINASGKTIAVIGSGISNIYPKENIKLAEEIIKKGGVIVSEYLPNEEPQKMHFPARNRIISGMSDGIIVVEAKKKSGTMITVDFALEQGKNIFAVPRKYY